jgi:uncharacterized protein (TIGR02145 family)
MCYNLGADPDLGIDDQMSYETASNMDATVLGDLYQWGRNTDGHEKRTSETTTTLATNIQATEPADVIGKFIADGVTPHWVTGVSDIKLWGYPKTGNDPCPAGWRVPRSQDIYDLFLGVNIYTGPGTYTNTYTWNSSGCPGMKVSTNGITTLFFPVAGQKGKSNGYIQGYPTTGYYHHATGADVEWKGYFVFTKDYIQTWASNWATEGRSVRCIAE